MYSRIRSCFWMLCENRSPAFKMNYFFENWLTNWLDPQVMIIFMMKMAIIFAKWWVPMQAVKLCCSVVKVYNKIESSADIQLLVYLLTWICTVKLHINSQHVFTIYRLFRKGKFKVYLLTLWHYMKKNLISYLVTCINVCNF